MTDNAGQNGRGGYATHHPATSAMQNLPANDKILNRLPLKAERSCVVCHRRKVRCDKKSPCSTCTRTGVLCCYPSGDRPLTRQPKTTIAKIASRLVQLERTIVAVSSDRLAKDPVGRAPSRAPSFLDGDDDSCTSAPAEKQSIVSVSTDEILIQNGFSSHYINEILLCRVLEEVCSARFFLQAKLTGLQGARNSGRFGKSLEPRRRQPR
jgi:Fungal Zn(2)-Cys(6) binuclear cluster domain